MIRTVLIAAACTFAPLAASAQQATFQIKALTPETALKAAQAALAACRAQGYQVAVAVVDRGGLPQVMLRDRFAGAHTPSMAESKAWTAASFRTGTTDLAAETQPGKPMSGIRQLPGVMAAGGGKVREGGGSIFGAIRVAGPPGDDDDDASAEAGIKAIADAVEF